MALRTTKLVQHRIEVRAAYEAGATMHDIGNLYGVSVGTVRNELISQGVTIRSRGRRKKVVTEEEAKPEFKINSLDKQDMFSEEVPVEVAPEIQVDPITVESGDNNPTTRVILDSDDSLTDIFGGTE